MFFFTFWPGQKCHSRWCTGRKWHILMAVMRGNRVAGNWLMKWDEVKKSHDTLLDWRTGREWPLNCMTSYFRLMTIKHSISKIAWPIKWALNYYIAQSRQKSRQLSCSQLETRVVGKATSGRRGFWALMSWGPEKMLIRCRKESHPPAEWPLDLRLSIWERERHNIDGQWFGL